MRHSTSLPRLVGLAVYAASLIATGTSALAGPAQSLVKARVDPVALNPQPLPPMVATASPVDRVALNPQPLPPKSRSVTSAAGKRSGTLAQRGIIIVSGKR
jgi:hypothetical protein